MKSLSFSNRFLALSCLTASLAQPLVAQPRPPRGRPAPTGDRAVLSALQRGEIETVKAALEADPELLKTSKPSLLHYAVNSRLGDETSRLAMAKFLLEKGADPNNSGPNLVYTPLITTIREGRHDLTLLLLEKGADPNKADLQGLTPLQHALNENKTDALLALIQGGVKLDRWDSRGLTPLQIVASSPDSDPKIVELMLQKGADLSTPTRAGTEEIASKRSERGWQPIHLAAQSGNVAVVKLLLQKGAAIEAKTPKGQTPLYLAAQNGAPTVQTLLEAGANAKIADTRGDAPLHAWLRAPIVARGAKPSDSPALKALILKSDLEARGQQGLTPLLMALQAHDSVARDLLAAQGPTNDRTTETFDAAAQNDVARLKKLLDERPFLATTVLPNGWTPLHMATRWNAFQSASLLLEKGADINARDASAASPLHRAMQGEKVTPETRKLIEFLVGKGADINARSDVEPFAAPGNGWKNRLDDTPLNRAIVLGDAELVKLFLQKGANLKARNEHRDTPLMIAVKTGKSALVPLLLEKGAEVDAADEVSYTPLHRAILAGDKDLIKLLLEKGADPNNGGRQTTLLIRAANNNDLDLARLLLAHKADPNAKTDSGETALSAAKKRKNTEMIEFLQQNGATE